MGILPIGFFSPLPLAMMIPFMATQSLAMGEAFGKSFQYGKRKISSMTNEEFNKYTTQDMMTEQTANIKMMIPALHEQMAASYSLQIDIFKEMVRIIPAFFEALLESLQPLASEFAAFNKTPFNEEIPSGGGTLVSASHHDDPTIISHEDYIPEIEIIETDQYSQAIFRAMPLDELIKGINSGRFKGSDLSMANHVLKERQQPEEEIIPLPKQNSVEWQANLDSLLRTFVTWRTILEDNRAKPRPDANIESQQLSRLSSHASKIRAISNDYRNPNDAIRRAVLKLRQDIANGLIKYR